MARPLNTFAKVPLPVVSEEDRKNLSYLDPENEWAMINLVPLTLRAAIEKLPPTALRRNERELRKYAKPEPEDCRIRIRFWEEYETAQREERRMSYSNITTGVCHADYFADVVLTDFNKLAFIVCPPADYQLAMKSLLDQGWRKLGEVLDLDFIEEQPQFNKKGELVRDDDGKVLTRPVVNTRLIAEMRNIVAMIDLRVKGAIIQKMQVHQVNENISHTASNQQLLGPDATFEQLEEMEKKLRSIEKIMDKVDTSGQQQQQNSSSDSGGPAIIEAVEVDEDPGSAAN